VSTQFGTQKGAERAVEAEAVDAVLVVQNLLSKSTATLFEKS
jgi:hypothetical protein